MITAILILVIILVGVVIFLTFLTSSFLIAFKAEKKERIDLHNLCAKQIERANQAEKNLYNLQQAAKSLVDRSVKANTPSHIDPKIKPLIDEIEGEDIPGHQKKMRVILQFMKENPGSSYASVEEAVNRIVNGSGYSS